LENNSYNFLKIIILKIINNIKAIRQENNTKYLESNMNLNLTTKAIQIRIMVERNKDFNRLIKCFEVERKILILYKLFDCWMKTKISGEKIQKIIYR